MSIVWHALLLDAWAGGGMKKEEDRGRKSTDEHDKILSPKRTASLRGETVTHTDLAKVEKNNKRYNEGRLIVVSLADGAQETLLVGIRSKLGPRGWLKVLSREREGWRREQKGIAGKLSSLIWGAEAKEQRRDIWLWIRTWMWVCGGVQEGVEGQRWWNRVRVCWALNVTPWMLQVKPGLHLEYNKGWHSRRSVLRWWF